MHLFYSTLAGKATSEGRKNLHKKFLKEAGLEHIRFHDLQHTFATLALQNGVDAKTVSVMLGHSNAGFTLATYTHTTTAAQHQAAAIMGSRGSTGMNK